MARSLHSDAPAILSRLQREGVTGLYHFTSVENLPSVCQLQALCSKKTLEGVSRWPPMVTGGRGPSHSLDQYQGNWDKVSLNLTSHTPMAYHRKREQHLCFFVIHPEVAAWSGAVFTDANAARNDHIRAEGLAGLNNIKFEHIRSNPRPWDRDGWHRFVQAEVLIPDRVPFEYVAKVVFVSNASMKYAERLCGSQSHPPFSVDWKLFADFSRSLQWTVDFPHLVELILTDTKIDENVVHLTHIHKNEFSKSNGGSVTLVALVNAMAGTEARVLLHPINVTGTTKDMIETTEFEKSARYYHWHSISLAELPEGVYSVEYYLNSLCWASTDFKVSS